MAPLPVAGAGPRPAPPPAGPTLAFTCHGARIGVRADAAELLGHVARTLPPGAALCPDAGAPDAAAPPAAAEYRWRVRPRADGRARHVVTVHCGLRGRSLTVARTVHAERAARALRHDAEFRVAVHATDALFLHAAAVAWRGRAIVIPGHSYAGKSTLTAALLRAGADYLSDEYAVVCADGLVHPFARPLHMRPPVRGASRDVSPDRFRAATVTAPLPIGLVVSTAFRDGRRWRPRRMTRGQIALALFERAVVARVRPAHALARIAAALDDNVLGLRGWRGDADETAALLLARATRAFGRAGRAAAPTPA